MLSVVRGFGLFNVPIYRRITTDCSLTDNCLNHWEIITRCRCATPMRKFEKFNDFELSMNHLAGSNVSITNHLSRIAVDWAALESRRWLATWILKTVKSGGMREQNLETRPVRTNQRHEIEKKLFNFWTSEETLQAQNYRQTFTTLPFVSSKYPTELISPFHTQTVVNKLFQIEKWKSRPQRTTSLRSKKRTYGIV